MEAFLPTHPKFEDCILFLPAQPFTLATSILPRRTVTCEALWDLPSQKVRIPTANAFPFRIHSIGLPLIMWRVASHRHPRRSLRRPVHKEKRPQPNVAILIPSQAQAKVHYVTARILTTVLLSTAVARTNRCWPSHKSKTTPQKFSCNSKPSRRTRVVLPLFRISPPCRNRSAPLLRLRNR
jgi:hypothetical protein